MKRWMRILMVVGFSSVYVMQGACTFANQNGIGGDGFSILPTTGLPVIGPILQSLPVIGGLFTRT